MKFWVVGSQGLVGLEMCAFLQRKEVDFVGSTKREADVLDPKALESFFRKHRPTHIVNCSAVVMVDQCENTEKERAYAVNVVGVGNLARLARQYQVRLLHMGTDYVFDGKEHRPYREGDPTRPLNEYGRTKLAGETLLFQEYPEAVEVRTSSVYGVWKKGLVWYTMQALQQENVINAVVDQISSPTYSKDLVEALFAVRDARGIFHFANAGEASRYDLTIEVKRVLQEKGVSLACERVEAISQKESGRSAERPVYSVLDCSKIGRLLSIRSWEEALVEYLEEIIYVRR